MLAVLACAQLQVAVPVFTAAIIFWMLCSHMWQEQTHTSETHTSGDRSGLAV